MAAVLGQRAPGSWLILGLATVVIRWPGGGVRLAEVASQEPESGQLRPGQREHPPLAEGLRGGDGPGARRAGCGVGRRPRGIRPPRDGWFWRALLPKETRPPSQAHS